MDRSSTCLAVVVMCAARLLAQTQTLSSEIPREAALEEQSVFISARMKNLAEMQDLIVQQQQLMLQHLDALRKEVEQLQNDRTNVIARSEWDGCMRRLDQLERQLNLAQETNSLPAASSISNNPPKPVESNESASTHRTSTVIRLQLYTIQRGDTLLKILARINDGQENNGLPRLTREQVEKANPGLNPEKIRVGQSIVLPVSQKVEALRDEPRETPKTRERP